MAFAPKIIALIIGLLLSGLLVSCVPQNRSAIKIKVLSLNPDEYVGSKVQVSGKVSGVGPGESYFLVEDDTGRILVGTEQISRKVGCPSQSNIELLGTLRRLKSVPQPYFSMESLISCKP